MVTSSPTAAGCPQTILLQVNPYSLRLSGSVVTCQPLIRRTAHASSPLPRNFVQRDLLGHAMHGQVTDDIGAIHSGLFHAPALESNCRILGDIEEISAPQIVIAIVILGIDTRDIDRGINR